MNSEAVDLPPIQLNLKPIRALAIDWFNVIPTLGVTFQQPLETKPQHLPASAIKPCTSKTETELCWKLCDILNESIKNSSKCDERGHTLRHNNYKKYSTFVTKQVEYSSQSSVFVCAWTNGNIWRWNFMNQTNQPKQELCRGK